MLAVQYSVFKLIFPMLMVIFPLQLGATSNKSYIVADFWTPSQESGIIPNYGNNSNDSMNSSSSIDWNQTAEVIKKTPELKIQKCCGKDQNLNFIKETKTWSCSAAYGKSALTWDIHVYKSPDDENGTIPFENGIHVDFILTGFPKCEFLSVANDLEIWFRVLEDGRPVVGLNFWLWPIWLPAVDKHCIDTVDVLDFEDEVRNGTITGRTETLLFCELESFDTYIVYRLLSAICYLISAFGAFLTILVYISVSEKFNIHRRAQISYFLAWFFFCTVEGSRIFTKIDGLNMQLGYVCVYLAVAAQYFSLTIGTTLCVLSFDMLCTFWKMEQRDLSKKSKTFLFYVASSWGIPLIVLISAFIVNHLTNPNAPKEEIGMYKYGHYRCSSPMWQLGAQIQCGMLLISSICFLVTFVIIIKTVWTTRAANEKCRNKKFFTQSVGLFLKLSMAMGMTLTISASEFYFGQLNPLGWMWVVERIFNNLMGLWLFLIFGCRRSHFQKLRRKYSQQSESSVVKNRYQSGHST